MTELRTGPVLELSASSNINAPAHAKLPAALERELQTAEKTLKAKYGPETSATLVAQLREAIVNKASINQGNATTCSQAALMYDLAANNPSELIRIVVTLAANGSCKLKDGTSVKLSATAFEKDFIPDDVPFAPRNAVERIFQDSLFDKFAKQKTVDSGSGPKTIRGMTANATLEMLEAVQSTSYTGIADPTDLQKVIGKLEQHALSGKTGLPEGFDANQVVINFMNQGKDALHAATVVGLRVDQQGKVFVQVFHGWGAGTEKGGAIQRTRNNETGIEEISLDDFKRTALAFSLKSKSAVVTDLGLKESMDKMVVPPQTYFAAPSDIFMQSIQALEADAKKRKNEYLESLSKRKT